MTRITWTIALIWIWSIVPFTSSYAQDTLDTLSVLNDEALNVFLDFGRGDKNFIRTEITYVNYVRDRTQADVHILATTRRTGTGGQEYTFTFSGHKSYADLHDTLTHFTSQMDTQDEMRRGYTQVIQMGLMRYVARTPLGRQISISFSDSQERSAQVRDRWNYWVFRINGSTSLRGEQRKNSKEIRGDVSVNRITEKWKTRLTVSGNFDEDNFVLSDGSKEKNTRHSGYLSMLHVKSLNDHWSLGIRSYVWNNSYNNSKLSLALSPALEYNFYPYVESTRHEFRFLYELGVGFWRYAEITLFDKVEEALYFEKLSITWENNKQWGRSEIELMGEHFFNDFNFYRLELKSSVNLRLFAGFSLRLSGNVERIKNQRSLAKEAGIDDVEVLLQRRQLETPYKYRANIGLTYTFGSIYTNIVNPRLGR
ncbi:MAG: hypothetical protein VYA69_14945 [Gemmatimonadota bacterium]|nr:hypothetical protein [Gemmatimonadota bacterium]